MIYIACPAAHATGGTELLHQLCEEFRLRGVEAKLWYHNARSGALPTPQRFMHYRVAYTLEPPPDRGDVFLIVPEVNTDLLYRFNYVKKCIWWLSVDFYKFAYRTYRYVINRYVFRHRYFLFGRADEDILHLYQSEYARQYLASHEVKKLFPLSDYLSDQFLRSDLEEGRCERGGRVLYNPKKGMKYTKLIASLLRDCPSIQFVPIERMNPAQIAGLMRESAVYIDFGHHPGKDRLPREAASMGCSVIVARVGSAANSVDVPVPDKYKFSLSVDGLRRASLLIKEIVASPHAYEIDFSAYREKIRAEKQLFGVQLQDLIVYLKKMGIV